MKKQIVKSKKTLTIAILLLSYSLVTDVRGEEGFLSKLKNWKDEKFSNLGQGYRDWQAGSWQTSVPKESVTSLWSRFKDNASSFGNNVSSAAKLHYGIRPSSWENFKNKMSDFGRNAELGQQERIARTTDIGKRILNTGYKEVVFPVKVLTYYPTRWALTGEGGLTKFDRQVREKGFVDAIAGYRIKNK